MIGWIITTYILGMYQHQKVLMYSPTVQCRDLSEFGSAHHRPLWRWHHCMQQYFYTRSIVHQSLWLTMQSQMTPVLKKIVNCQQLYCIHIHTLSLTPALFWLKKNISLVSQVLISEIKSVIQQLLGTVWDPVVAGCSLGNEK